MQLSKDKLVVKDESGKVVNTINFEKWVLDPNELSPQMVGFAPDQRLETLKEYGDRIEPLIKMINDQLRGWNGRGEGEGTKTRTGLEGALNMGIDLALRQVHRPKPLTAARLNQMNRQAALAWVAAEAFKPDGLVKQERVLQGIANADKFADEIINEFGDQIPGLK